MDTSQYSGTPPDDVIAAALAPVIEAARIHLNLPVRRRIAELFAAQFGAQQDVRQRIIASFAQQQLPAATRVAQAMQQLEANRDTALRSITQTASVQQRMFESLAEIMAAQRTPIVQLQRTLTQTAGLDRSWIDRIAANLYATSLDTRVRNTMGDALDELYDTIEDTDVALSDDGGFDDLDVIGVQGMAFVTAEGQGLSREAQRRLLVWFVAFAVFGILLQGVMQSDAVKELVEDSGMVMPVAAAAMVIAGRQFDKVFPRPDGDPDEEAGE